MIALIVLSSSWNWMSQHVVLQKDEFLRLIINSIRNDLISRNEAFQCLALSFIGNGLSATWLLDALHFLH